MEKYVKKIEINCDMGEGYGRWKMGPDEELMKIVDYANIACGFHAGDPTTMLKTIRLAKAHNVKIGAHPGLEDRFGFGRRRIEVDPEDMYALVLYQIGALKALLDAEGVPLNHIKPHGELFFYMQRDDAILDAVLRACAVYGVPVFGSKGTTKQGKACAELGLPFLEEAYVDLQYDRHGKLLPASESKPATVDEIYNRTVSICTDDRVTDNEGNLVTLGFGDKKPFLFCIHSDLPNALESAVVCRKAVDEANARRGCFQQTMDWSLHETFSLGDFNLQSGGVLSGAFLAYKTFGDVKNPAIVLTTCYAASISDYKGIVGPNSKSLDTNRYFIIIPALIGNGESVSPSNRPDLRGQFPVVTFYDNVRAQYQLVHDHLGIDHVKAVCGFSMGGGQAYQWAVQYPDFVDVSVPICTSARTSIHNNVFLEGVKAAIVAARGGVSAGIGKGQIYPTNEPWTDAQKDVAMKALGRVYAGWGFSQAWYRKQYYQKYLGIEDIDTFLQVFWEGWATKNDPEDMLLMLQTWQLADVSKTSPEFQGDLRTALKHIRCRMLVMPGKTDMYFPAEDSEYEVGLMEPGIGSLVVIPSIWGHWAGGMGDSPEDWAFVDSQMSQAFEDVKR